MSRGRYVLGITRFSDLTLEEFKSKHVMPPASQRSRKPRAAAADSTASQSSRAAGAKMFVANTAGALPTCNIDWREPSLNRLRRNVVTSIKDQADCGKFYDLKPSFYTPLSEAEEYQSLHSARLP